MSSASGAVAWSLMERSLPRPEHDLSVARAVRDRELDSGAQVHDGDRRVQVLHGADRAPARCGRSPWTSEGSSTTPSQPRTTWPEARMLSMIAFAMLIGIVKPTPWYPPERLAIAVLIPMIRPWMSTSGPPELPGLIAAS